MRDIIVLIIILGAAPICLFRPYFGLLMWSWIAYFNPHRFTWGIAYNFPVAMVIAIPTLLGTVFYREINRKFLARETILMILLWIWFGVTLVTAMNIPLFADHVAEAQSRMVFVSKIFLITGISILLVTSKEKLRYLFLVTGLSFGALAVKGAVFGMFTSGQFRVFGPPDSFIADNNAFALAMNMALPILYFLGRNEKNRILRIALRVSFFASALCVLLTYSRGGLLGLLVVVAMIALKSRHKVASIFAMVAVAFLMLTFLPAKWSERMDRLAEGHLDQSAQQRLVSWGFAWNLAKHYPITGGGFETFTPALFERYALEPLPGGETSSGPHSIYFQVLAEHGFVGLGLFLGLLGSCWLTLRTLRRRVRRMPEVRWITDYSHMLETSLFAFLVSGAFLEFAYFDLYFQIVACTVVLKILYRREVVRIVAAREVEPAPLAMQEQWSA